MNTRANRVLAVAVVGLLLLAVVAAVLAQTRDRPRFTEGTPEATVQAYLQAVVAGDGEEAVRHLDPEVGCTASQVEEGWVGPGVRVVLRDSSTDGDRARARVDVITPSGGLLDPGEWTDRQTFELRRVDGEWLITGSPWPTYDCPPEVAP